MFVNTSEEYIWMAPSFPKYGGWENHSSEYQILTLLDMYCFCPSDLNFYWDEPWTSGSSNLVTKFPSRAIKPRKKNKLLKSRNICSSLASLEKKINRVIDDKQICVHQSNKSKMNYKSLASGRRSRFIGVSKNGDVWQSLIMIDGKKTYIGSYLTEEEAGMSYDFYSIILKHFSAKTNFEYTVRDIKKMLANYYDNNMELVPSALF